MSDVAASVSYLFEGHPLVLQHLTPSLLNLYTGEEDMSPVYTQGVSRVVRFEGVTRCEGGGSVAVIMAVLSLSHKQVGIAHRVFLAW